MRSRNEQVRDLIDRLTYATTTGEAKWTQVGPQVFRLERGSGTVILQSGVFSLGTTLKFLDADGEVVIEQTDGAVGSLTSWVGPVKPGSINELFRVVEEQLNTPAPEIDEFLGDL